MQIMPVISRDQNRPVGKFLPECRSGSRMESAE
jgi:hypothetical protein